MLRLVVPVGGLIGIMALAGFWLFIARAAREDDWKARVAWSGTCTAKSLEPTEAGYDLQFACRDREVVWNDSNLAVKFALGEPIPALACTIAKSGLLACAPAENPKRIP